MGVAIIISDADYSARGKGTITPTVSVPITGLSIMACAPVDNKIRLRAVYSPMNTTQRAVTWSILSGSQYASVNEVSGEIEIKEGANESPVEIVCNSVSTPGVSATKTIAVTYTGPQTLLDVEPLLTNSSGVEFGAGNSFILDAHIDTPSKVGAVKYYATAATSTAGLSLVVANSERKVISITPITIDGEVGEVKTTDILSLGVVVPAGGYVGFKHTQRGLYFNFGTTDIKTGTDESASFDVGSTFNSFNYSGLIWNIGFTLVEA